MCVSSHMYPDYMLDYEITPSQLESIVSGPEREHAPGVGQQDHRLLGEAASRDSGRAIPDQEPLRGVEESRNRQLPRCALSGGSIGCRQILSHST